MAHDGPDDGADDLYTGTRTGPDGGRGAVTELPTPAPARQPSGERSATADAGGWAPVDADPATPTRVAPVAATAVRRLRLRRSRNPVLAALDGGGDVLQRRGRVLLVGVVVLAAPMVVLNLWTTVLAFDRLDGGGPSLLGFGDDAATGIEEVALVLALVLLSLTTAIVGTFAASILVADRFGSAVGLAAGLRATLRLAPATVAAWLLGHWWLPFLDAWTVSAHPDDEAARLFLVAPVAWMLSSLLLYVVPVIVAERVGPIRALRRSWRLSRMRFGAAIGFVACSTAVGALLLAGTASLPTLLEATGLVTFGDYTWLANGIALQLGAIITVPLVALATAQMYLEIRLHAEGMDLMLDADRAFGPRPVAG